MPALNTMKGKLMKKNITVWIKIAVTGVVTLLVWPLAGSPEMKAPIDQVRDAVVDVLRLLEETGHPPGTTKEQRRQMIIEIIDKGFDSTEMSRRTLFRHWDKISAREQRLFVEKYMTLLKNKYIGRLYQYSGQRVVFEKQIIKKSHSAVFTYFEQNNEKFVIVYLLKKSDTGWLIYDFVIEGVSVVKNYRSQFDVIIKNESFSGLLERIEKRNTHTVL